jgi:hypothetical protein
MLTPQFNSNYNSLQGLFQHRFSGASQVNVAYTWAKNLTDNQTDRSTAPMNSYDIKADYGRATLDRRHILTTNYIYELPFYQKRHDLAGNVLGGWQVSGIFTYQTGLPFTALGANFDGAGLGNIPALVAGNRPISLCDPNTGARNTFEVWFNTQCFQLNPTAPPVPNIVSNTSRGTIEGPPTVRFDFSLFKNMNFGEDGRVRLQLRGEFFNIFNHTNFRAISSTITAANYGQVTTVRDPRTIQIGAKLSF